MSRKDYYPGVARLVTDKFKDFPRDDPAKLVHKAQVWQNRVIGDDHGFIVGQCDGVLTFNLGHGKFVIPTPLPVYCSTGIPTKVGETIVTKHVTRRKP